MTSQPGFQAEVHQNPYLPAAGTVVDAVVSVAASAVARHAAAGPPDAAQVIMVDCSGSMDDPPSKMAEAKKATIAAIESLRDGVAFAVVAGRDYAELVYPPAPPLVPASRQSRVEAQHAVSRLGAGGGTAVGSWLRLTNNLFTGHPAEVKHAIMLTDGRNEHETPRELATALRGCERHFVCDTRGVGSDWSGTELRLVASALLGTADGLAHPEELVADFRLMTETAMGKALGEVTLRLWTPAGSTIRFVKQVFPHVDDLTGRRSPVSPRIGDYPTGAWGTESRDYHISVDLPAGATGEERLAARVSLVDHDQVLVESRVTATWTADQTLYTRINPRVAHYTGQAELATAIQDGLAARAAGDAATATAKLGRAVHLAHLTGHHETVELLSRLVDVIDPRHGTVRLRDDATGVDAELANVRSVRTVRIGHG
ncbi:VWA domain-containing protein [Phytohabitans sp. ZYX-F-186]|uniref:VWA domain-containing protein n=1 Tax=Phytohabitans maris TaxID=3071409 RepID=A0ABU0ZDT1_9ACTN|nr:VWA domain-containing protein [Phytohabitans sp. ZYX-F-186]MDQ7905216.1 VWA domain-containing protein [Phytohabitans sp. ZYX-F-186]